MGDVAGWIAPIATMLAAMMTAANLGPRTTGWGFVVFTIGSIAWTTVAITTDQPNLLWANGFLTIVNLVGIWRWLGREAKYDDGARTAQTGSHRAGEASLFPVATIAGRPLLDEDGATIGQAIGAMADCERGAIAYVVVARGGMGGVGELLHAIAWDDLRVGQRGFILPGGADALAALARVDPNAWPTKAPDRQGRRHRLRPIISRLRAA